MPHRLLVTGDDGAQVRSATATAKGTRVGRPKVRPVPSSPGQGA
jgi:hypothetical protein